MKSLLFVIPFGLLLSVSCGNSLHEEVKLQREITSITSRISSSNHIGNNALEDYWPFEETLKTEDPFISELLVMN